MKKQTITNWKGTNHQLSHFFVHDATNPKNLDLIKSIWFPKGLSIVVYILNHNEELIISIELNQMRNHNA